MKKLSVIVNLMMLSLSLSVNADQVYYQIKMSGNPVGYISYEVKSVGDDLAMQTTVLFNIGQSELNQKIKLEANTRLNSQTQLPIEYHLSLTSTGLLNRQLIPSLRRIPQLNKLSLVDRILTTRFSCPRRRISLTTISGLTTTMSFSDSLTSGNAARSPFIFLPR